MPPRRASGLTSSNFLPTSCLWWRHERAPLNQRRTRDPTGGTSSRVSRGRKSERRAPPLGAARLCQLPPGVARHVTSGGTWRARNAHGNVGNSCGGVAGLREQKNTRNDQMHKVGLMSEPRAERMTGEIHVSVLLKIFRHKTNLRVLNKNDSGVHLFSCNASFLAGHCLYSQCDWDVHTHTHTEENRLGPEVQRPTNRKCGGPAGRVCSDKSHCSQTFTSFRVVEENTRVHLGESCVFIFF